MEKAFRISKYAKIKRQASFHLMMLPGIVLGIVFSTKAFGGMYVAKADGTYVYPYERATGFKGFFVNIGRRYGTLRKRSKIILIVSVSLAVVMILTAIITPLAVRAYRNRPIPVVPPLPRETYTFEAEDPKMLFGRSAVFSFLLLASPQLCELVLDMTSRAITLLELPNAVNVHLVDASILGNLLAGWLVVIIFNFIIMLKVLKLLLKIAEQYVVLSTLTIAAPLAFSMGGSKSTAPIFTGWCRM